VIWLLRFVLIIKHNNRTLIQTCPATSSRLSSTAVHPVKDIAATQLLTAKCTGLTLATVICSAKLGNPGMRSLWEHIAGIIKQLISIMQQLLIYKRRLTRVGNYLRQKQNPSQI